MSEVALLSKYSYAVKQDGTPEDPEVTALRLHARKNKAINPNEEAGIEFPSYIFTPYPTAMYRDWTDERREDEITRIAGKHMLDLEKRQDRRLAETLVGAFETINVGRI